MKYEYYCKKCANTFTTVEKMIETGSSYPCPSCGELSGKVYSSPSIHGFRQGPKVMYNEK